MKTTVAVLDKEGKNVVERLLDTLNTLGGTQPSHFGLISPKKSVFEKSPGILSRQGINSSTAAGYVSSKPAASNGYQFLQLADAALVFEGRVYSPAPQNAIMEQVAKDPLHCETLLHTFMASADGDYSFLIVKECWIGAGRDPIGVQPLYYGESKSIAAIATNREALWLLGIEDPLSFQPGNIAYVNRGGFQFKPIKTLSLVESKRISIDKAAKKLQTLLEQSTERRVHDVKEVAVAFSGGLDSSLIAYLASKLGAKVNLFHVSMENQPETEEAIETSEQLNLPLQVDLFKDSDVENTLPQVVTIIEEADPIKASVGLPFYWAAEKAAEAHFKVMLAGQGADELFGGYQRYVNEYCKGGGEKVRKTMFNDVVNIYKTNLERDFKITDFHDVELRLPFASFELVDFALSLPIECKIEKKPDTLRKLVLRKAAFDIGIPSSVVSRPKKAVQYSTGINDAIKRIAKKHDKTVNQYITELLNQSKKGK